MDIGQDEAIPLQRAIAGDMDALAGILEAHSPRILQYISRHFPAELSGTIDPADVLQDTCFEACRLIGGFVPQGEDCLYRWLVTVARHRMIDLLRAHRTRAKFGKVWSDLATDAVASLLMELAVYSRTPSKSAASHEFMKVLEKAIGRLAPDHAQVVTLRHIQGLSVAETAQQMGKTDESVYWLTCRALQALRTDLGSMSLHL